MKPADQEFFRLSPFLAELRGQLEQLAVRRQRGFALACAERTLAVARTTSSEIPSVLTGELDALWQVLLRESELDAKEVVRSVSLLERLAEAEDEMTDATIDAAGALWLALEAWRDDPSTQAARAAGNVLNQIFQAEVDEEVGRDHAMSAGEDKFLRERIERGAAIKHGEEEINGWIRILQTRVSDPEAFSELRVLAARL